MDPGVGAETGRLLEIAGPIILSQLGAVGMDCARAFSMSVYRQRGAGAGCMIDLHEGTAAGAAGRA